MAVSEIEEATTCERLSKVRHQAFPLAPISTDASPSLLANPLKLRPNRHAFNFRNDAPSRNNGLPNVRYALGFVIVAVVIVFFVICLIYFD